MFFVSSVDNSEEKTVALQGEAPRVERAINAYMEGRSKKVLHAQSPKEVAQILGLPDIGGGTLRTILFALHYARKIQYVKNSTGHTITLYGKRRKAEKKAKK